MKRKGGDGRIKIETIEAIHRTLQVRPLHPLPPFSRLLPRLSRKVSPSPTSSHSSLLYDFSPSSKSLFQPWSQASSFCLWQIGTFCIYPRFFTVPRSIFRSPCCCDLHFYLICWVQRTSGVDHSNRGDAKPDVQLPEEDEEEIIESDVELEGEIVEPDNDPPQKVHFSFFSVFFPLPCFFGRFFQCM